MTGSAKLALKFVPSIRRLRGKKEIPGCLILPGEVLSGARGGFYFLAPLEHASPGQRTALTVCKRCCPIHQQRRFPGDFKNDHSVRWLGFECVFGRLFRCFQKLPWLELEHSTRNFAAGAGVVASRFV